MITFLLSLTLFATKIAFIILLFNLLKLIEQQKSAQRPTRQRATARQHISIPDIEPLRRKAISLTRDHGTVIRLYELARSNNPHQHDRWIWEKVIWDLERDRH